MRNDKEYGYYGELIPKTYSHEECTETLEQHMIDAKLSPRDEKLLEEYVPMLFDTLPKGIKSSITYEEIDLNYAIKNLIMLLGIYRRRQSGREKMRSQKVILPLSKQNINKKRNYLKNHAKAILDMIGKTDNHAAGDFDSFKAYELKKNLESLICSPETYLPEQISFSKGFGNKKDIKEYLRSDLTLPYNGTIISEFLQQLA